MKSFKYISTNYKNFRDNEKCLLSKKFKIRKQFTENEIGILSYDRVKKGNMYGKINAIILSISGTSYKIKIVKDYNILNLYENDIYMVDYRLLSKCSHQAWNKLLAKDLNNNLDSNYDDILDSEGSLEETEIDFINNNKNEFN